MIKNFAIAFALVLAGCATGMSYHPWDSTYQLGYTDTQLSEKVFRVSYAGYNIPQNACEEFALMRAAELAKQSGYKYFRVLDEKQTNQSQSFFIPGTTQTSGTASTYGNVTSFNATSSSGGYAGTIQRPVSTLTVELMKEKIDAPSTLDADIVWNSLAKKHGVAK